ncbi:MAG: molybdopterin-binding protein [Kiritimatiellia bacterium]|jgi:molybdenum cofactor synthesis domain-containing protein|nr:molybdopterin-binding protein [Kiritimatiellia bacterium]MDP6630435.1 molybdopterin-binding protein [Kiritimatiellia bacterium]MDP6809892.1 molybdopterin-binding protein [Kiritimatiellia bacterium]MDP7024284.1 molybdopterin-binding protein [Kiritimatiellia bacterium]
MTSQDKGRIDAICLSARKGERKTPVEQARLVAQQGFEGDAHAGDWHRQVSLLAAGDVDDMKAKGLPDLKAGDFAENLVVSGIDLYPLGLGSRLRIGNGVELSVSQLGKTCHAHCAIYHQTGDCIMPRLGVFARVLTGGEIKEGDAVEIMECVPRDTLQVVVLTISDRCSRGEAEDTAGPAVARRLEAGLGAHLYQLEVIPDEQEQIAARMKHYADGHSIDLVVAVGGTGFSPRDVTPEAVRSVVDRLTPGLDEAMRTASMTKTPRAMLSRSASGICQQTLIMSTPGSERAASESIDAVMPALGHGIKKMKGDPSDCGR